MVKDVQTVLDSEPISRAKAIMVQGDFSQVPVLDAQGQLVGVITERSLLDFLSEGWQVQDLSEFPVGDALAQEVVGQVRPNAPLIELIQKLQDPKIQMLAVVAEGRLCGIVTRADVIRFTL